jgi:hypothetical protein
VVRKRGLIGCMTLMLALAAVGQLGLGSASARATCKPERECVKPKREEVKGPADVNTEPAKRTRNGFKLRGELNPNGSPTTYYFIYKKSGEVECEDLEGCGPETPRGGPVTASRELRVASEVTGLAPGTTYIFWIIARNAQGTRVGRQLTFTTRG